MWNYLPEINARMLSENHSQIDFYYTSHRFSQVTYFLLNRNHWNASLLSSSSKGFVVFWLVRWELHRCFSSILEKDYCPSVFKQVFLIQFRDGLLLLMRHWSSLYGQKRLITETHTYINVCMSWIILTLDKVYMKCCCVCHICVVIIQKINQSSRTTLG